MQRNGGTGVVCCGDATHCAAILVQARGKKMVELI